ncbi:hypothetical protein NMY22_g2914 [Coprinellus aureogranulatus]|nr:hypothetical protein NMY22_g2914 [Coprinellus aureogranulatus]
MAHNLPAPEVSLYVWPGLWDLPSYDPYSLSAILYLQLAIPGQFSVIECTDPDLSPSGQLPFLVHGQEAVASYPSIVRYVAGLARPDRPTYPGADVDSFLSASSKSQKNAWLAHVEANLGNLVATVLFAQEENWEGFTLKSLATLFPVPQKYFVPSKLRVAYQPRLDAAGLWNPLPPVEEKKKTPFEKELRQKPSIDKRAFRQTFVREKIVEKAKPILDVYDRLLGNKRYIFDDKISSLDVALAARILLLTKPAYPDGTIKDLITTSYPNLVEHARRVEDRVLGSNTLPKVRRHDYSLWSLLPWARRALKPCLCGSRRLGLVVGVVCAYVAVLAPSRLALANDILRQQRQRFYEDDVDDDEEDGEDEEEDEGEGEEL